MNKRDAILKAFEAKVARGAPDACWDVAGASKGEYGSISFEGKTYRAHRLAYRLFVGPIPKGMLVCHRCDNPACCNPNHLFLGTHSDNAVDKVRKGRHNKREASQPAEESAGTDLGIIHTLKRKAAVLNTEPDRHTGLRRIAQSLDRRLGDAAVAELLTEALHRVTELAYQTDAAGWVNVDDATGRVLIPVPWGRAGRSMWGLYPSEGDSLKIILRRRQASEGHTPLYWYDAGRRAWYIHLGAYPTFKAALDYLKVFPITVEEYRLAYAKAMEKRPP